MEHLGACIYGGCWVGEQSRIPNTRGIRNDVIQALSEIRPAVIRWPGGCFADDYHWRDGVGLREHRPTTVNIHWGETLESNEFGTHEFLDLCRMTGAEPYLCGNVGSGSPRELRDWVEYCNYAGDSSLAQLRARNGSAEPFKVRFWGVGNELWGCGGNLSPEDYAADYRRYATFMRNYSGSQLHLIACGPNGNDLEWTRRFFARLRRDYGQGERVHGFAAHYYCGTAGSALEYTEDQWTELLARAAGIENLIRAQSAALREVDPDGEIGLIIDEWGTWHPATPGENPSFLWQQNTIRDALVAAITLNIFNNHAAVVTMANIAQTINVLQAVLLTEEDRLVRTPTWHVYRMFAPHQGADALRTQVDSELAPGRFDMPLVAASASSLARGSATLTLTNSSATCPVDVQLRAASGRVRITAAETLAAPGGDYHAHNTFQHPDAVASHPLQHDEESDVVTLPAASVTRLSVKL
ncbi:MAG: alpha-N-arabinofuranosidase [Armatimonadetes bacterium]|nr:alpha-N-arabinofuranosidase [Armatimonadota bacterium]MDE2206597.1 alpha-N-arabinofuranosidase [Armatimonadota bacterium]